MRLQDGAAPEEYRHGTARTDGKKEAGIPERVERVWRAPGTDPGGRAMGAVAPPLGDFFSAFCLYFCKKKRDRGLLTIKWTKSEEFFEIRAYNFLEEVGPIDGGGAPIRNSPRP